MAANGVTNGHQKGGTGVKVIVVGAGASHAPNTTQWHCAIINM